MQPEKIATVETDLFEHRTVKPHFINPCCFGEDFCAWLRSKLADLSREGFSFSDPIQEDYGWGMWATCGVKKFWIAVSYVGTGPTEQPAQWVVSVLRQEGLMKRLFKKPDVSSLDALRNRIRNALESTSGITIIKAGDAN